ncbi:hypothetical protein B0H63DRAFT_478514 [Podospora didyma]|uniref:Uncharacterized protein n=1 Tax=Podospora didyma TaxID=330526 RepID=A0AAE0KK82_9PEZI|nr:hypothetical protein B0H63DRAFT_478514 [Podospora didyma]
MKAHRVTFLSNMLIGHDPIGTFAGNCEKTLPDWTTLLRIARVADAAVRSKPIP